MNEISVSDLKRRHDAGEDVMLLDVREPDELEIASIPWATVIPIGQVPERIGELPRDKPIAVMCHAGGRSSRVTEFLAASGYDNAMNVTGGITAWSDQIDPSVPKY